MLQRIVNWLSVTIRNQIVSTCRKSLTRTHLRNRHKWFTFLNFLKRNIHNTLNTYTKKNVMWSCVILVERANFLQHLFGWINKAVYLLTYSRWSPENVFFFLLSYTFYRFFLWFSELSIHGHKNIDKEFETTYHGCYRNIYKI